MVCSRPIRSHPIEAATMSSDTVALAADHAGYELKKILAEELRARGVPVLDLGTDGPDSVDYPDYADALATAIKGARAKLGVLICGSGKSDGEDDGEKRQIKEENRAVRLVYHRWHPKGDIRIAATLT